MTDKLLEVYKILVDIVEMQRIMADKIREKCENEDELVDFVDTVQPQLDKLTEECKIFEQGTTVLDNDLFTLKCEKTLDDGSYEYTILLFRECTVDEFVGRWTLIYPEERGHFKIYDLKLEGRAALGRAGVETSDIVKGIRWALPEEIRMSKLVHVDGIGVPGMGSDLTLYI